MSNDNRPGRSRYKPAAAPTVRGLENAALHYLGRFAASEGKLRGVLKNRLRRAAMRNHAFAEDDVLQASLRAAIEDIITKHRKAGVLNDAAFAEMKTASLRRAGRSARAIRQRLGQSGVARDVVEDALTGGDEDYAAAEMKAALALAKRKRLGIFRGAQADPLRQRKDLAVLARAGFSLDVARRALRGE